MIKLPFAQRVTCPKSLQKYLVEIMLVLIRDSRNLPSSLKRNRHRRQSHAQ
jgi:hypothetical protein